MYKLGYVTCKFLLLQRTRHWAFGLVRIKPNPSIVRTGWLHALKPSSSLHVSLSVPDAQYDTIASARGYFRESWRQTGRATTTRSCLKLTASTTICLRSDRYFPYIVLHRNRSLLSFFVAVYMDRFAVAFVGELWMKV